MKPSPSPAATVTPSDVEAAREWLRSTEACGNFVACGEDCRCMKDLAALIAASRGTRALTEKEVSDAVTKGEDLALEEEYYNSHVRQEHVVAKVMELLREKGVVK